MTAQVDVEIDYILARHQVAERGDTDQWVRHKARTHIRQQNRRRQEIRDELRRLDPARALRCDAIDPIVEVVEEP